VNYSQTNTAGRVQCFVNGIWNKRLSHRRDSACRRQSPYAAYCWWI